VDRARLAVLRAEMEKQLETITAIYQRVEQRREGTSPAHLESLGYQLHNLYCRSKTSSRLLPALLKTRLPAARITTRSF